MDAYEYPTLDERRNFYRAYLSPAQPAMVAGRLTVTESPGVLMPASASSVSPSSPPVPPIHGSNTNPSPSNSTSPAATSIALRNKSSFSSTTNIALNEAPAESDVDPIRIDQLEEEVKVWTPAALAQWTIWGIVQARDDVLAGGVGEFDYLNYSRGRVKVFREHLKGLGVIV